MDIHRTSTQLPAPTPGPTFRPPWTLDLGTSSSRTRFLDTEIIFSRLRHSSLLLRCSHHLQHFQEHPIPSVPHQPTRCPHRTFHFHKTTSTRTPNFSHSRDSESTTAHMSYSQGDSRKFVASAMGNGRYGGGSVSSAPEASLTAPVSPTTLSTDSEDGGESYLCDAVPRWPIFPFPSPGTPVLRHCAHFSFSKHPFIPRSPTSRRSRRVSTSSEPLKSSASLELF